MTIPEKRRQILETFMKEPFEEIHLREIARRSKVSLNNVKSAMFSFEEQKMFNKRTLSRMTLFRPNLKSEILLKTFEYLELEKKHDFFTKNKQIARLLQKYTENLIVLSKKSIQMVLLFGSVARGEWTKESDIDILSVASNNESDIISALSKAKIEVSPLLEINSISTTPEKFIEGFRNKLEFYAEIWKDRIVLYNEFLFWQLIKEVGKLNV